MKNFFPHSPFFFFKNALGGNTLKTKEFFCFFTTEGLDPPGFVPDIILSGRSAPRRRRLPAVHRKYDVFSLYRRKTPRLSLERKASSAGRKGSRFPIRSGARPPVVAFVDRRNDVNEN